MFFARVSTAFWRALPRVAPPRPKNDLSSDDLAVVVGSTPQGLFARLRAPGGMGAPLTPEPTGPSVRVVSPFAAISHDGRENAPRSGAIG